MNYGASIVVPAMAAILSGLVILGVQEFISHRRNKKRKAQAHASEHDEERAEQMSLILKYLNAIGKLTHANSIALRDHKTNGELKDAMKEYEEMDGKMYDYLVTHGLK